MKKLFVLVILLSFISAGFSAEKNLLTTDAFSLLFGVLNASYEMLLNEKTSVSVGLGGSTISTDDWKISVIGIKGGYYIYPSKTALKGFFVGPAIGFSIVSAEYTYNEITGTWPYWKIQEKTDKASNVLVSISGELGYRWIWESGFSLGLGIGAGFYLGSIEIAGEKAPYGGTGLTRLSVDIGYAW